MPSTKSTKQLRLRVFAGLNGSGKSTVIEFIRKQKIKGYKIDFGYYVNAEDIAVELTESGINFQRFGIKTSKSEFKLIAMASGLVGNELSDAEFLSSLYRSLSLQPVSRRCFYSKELPYIYFIPYI